MILFTGGVFEIGVATEGEKIEAASMAIEMKPRLSSECGFRIDDNDPFKMGHVGRFLGRVGANHI